MNKNSLAAYRKIGEHLDSHYYAIYEALLIGGPMTAWGIAANTWFEISPTTLDTPQVFRRLSEMVKAGWIVKLDWNTVTPTGCYASTYWLSTKETK